jgi:hypothetical protein
MKLSKIGTMILAALVGLSAHVAQAFDCDTTMTQSGDWDTDGNWDGGTPTSSDNACIDTGVTATVASEDTDAICENLWIKSTAKIVVESPRTLSIVGTGTSELDDDIELQRGATLDLVNCPTIEGDGGKITGLSTGSGDPAVILADNDAILTGVGGTEGTSLVVEGYLDIQGRIDNNAFVVANDPQGALTLSDQNKLGSGMWIARNGATLSVGVLVSGSAGWEMIHDEDSKIHFHTANSTGLTGDFEITNGTLDIDVNVTTTGSLLFYSDEASHPRIEVASGKVAIFD